MRFCVKCGNNIGNERFCIRCGADNGAAPVAENPSGQINAETLVKKGVLRLASIACFAIAALIMLVSSIVNAQAIASYSMLCWGNCILAVIAFAFGVWSAVPAVTFVLNNRKQDYKSVMGAAIALAVTMIILSIVMVILESVGNGKVLSKIFDPYCEKTVAVIIFSVLAVVAGAAGMKLEK